MFSRTSLKGNSQFTRYMLRGCGLLLLAGCALMCSPAMAQQEDAPRPPDQRGDRQPGPPPMEGRRPPMERAFHAGPPGRWWNNPDFAKSLALTTDQQTKMDAVFQQSRPHLIDLSAALQKEEVYMEPLLSADQPDESRVLAQIDRIAAARAELEKANARMLLGLRRILTQDQWKKLQADEPRQHGRGGPPSSGHDRRPGPS